MKMRMTIEGTPPSVKHSEKTSSTSPVPLLKGFECLRCGREEQLGGDPVVVLKEPPHFLRERKDDVKVGAIRKAFAHLLGPLGLSRPEARRTMTVTAGTGIPLVMTTVGAFRIIVAKGSVTAVSHQVELGILLPVEPSGPEVAPLSQNCVDRLFDAVTLNMY